MQTLLKVRGEYYEIGKDYGDHTRKVTPGQKQQKSPLMSGITMKPFVNSTKIDMVKIGSSN